MLFLLGVKKSLFVAGLAGGLLGLVIYVDFFSFKIKNIPIKMWPAPRTVAANNCEVFGIKNAVIPPAKFTYPKYFIAIVMFCLDIRINSPYMSINRAEISENRPFS